MAKDNKVNPLTPEEQAELNQAIAKANEEVLAAGNRGFTGTGFERGAFAPSATTVHGGFQDHNHAQQIKNMREADKAYREVGIVRNVIDIMTDFASEGLSIDHPVEAQQRFYEAWAKKVNVQELTRQILQGMYKWGNVGVFRFWGKIRPRTRREMMAKARELFAQGKDREATKAFFRDNKKFQKSRIPVRYTCIPPFRIRIFGTILFDDRRHFYNLSNLDRLKLENPEENATPMERTLIDQMPEATRLQLHADGFIEMPKENFDMFHYKRDCSRLWADPLVLPIMDDLRYKKLLRRLDMSVAESIINPITVFKLGKTVEGFAPTKEMFQNLATLLKTPVQTKTLVWSDLIEVEQHHVDAKDVLTMDKYLEVNDAILAGLGISSVLINGGQMSGGRASGGFAGAFLSVRTLLERLEDARTVVLRFLNKEVETIRRAMGWSTKPVIHWSQMSLKDEAAEKRIVMDLLDRKVISAESALSFLGFDKDIEMRRKQREDKVSDRTGVVHSVGPFEQGVQVQQGEDPGTRSADLGEKDLDLRKEDLAEKRKIMEQKQKEQGQTGPSRGPGRPVNQGDEESRRQKTERKPRVTATMVEHGMRNRKLVENWWKPRYLEALGKDNLRQLTADERAAYDDCIRAIYSRVPMYSNLTEESVERAATEIMEGGVYVNSQFAEIRQELIESFRRENGRKPVTSEMKRLDSEAYAAYRQTL